MRKAFLAAGFAGLLGLCSPAHGATGETVAGVDGKWRHYQSLHFELFSHRGDTRSRELLHNLELLRAVFFDTLQLKEIRPVEISIFYFDSERVFRVYTPAEMRKSGLAAFYLNRADRAVIVISPQQDSEESQRIIFHEYIHHLTTISGDTPALWYVEGIAELFSTIEEERDGMVLGRPIPAHIDVLQLQASMPLEWLFSVRHGSPVYNENTLNGLFYAESWALLHYWYFGSSKLPHEKVEDFLRHVRHEGEAGDSNQRRELFQQMTGMDYPAMGKLLHDYVINGRFGERKMPAPKIAPRESYTVRQVARDEIREQLTELDFRVNRSPAAKLALLNRLEKTPGDVRPYEILGSDALQDGDDSIARERWQEAIAAGTQNPAIFHELALLESRRWFSEFDLLYFRLPDETARYLRDLLKRSIKSAPNQRQAYEMLAWVEATAEVPSVANVNLVQKHFPELKEKYQTMVALALVRLHLKDEATARKILDDLEQMPPPTPPFVQKSTATLRAFMDAQHPVTP